MLTGQLDVGFFLGPVVYLGASVRYGQITTNGSCASGLHGPTPTSPTDIETRYAFDRCWLGRTGLALLFHTAPRSRLDPWFGFDFSFVHAELSARTYDPLGGAGTEKVETNALLAGGQLGLDWHILESYRPFLVGSFLSVSAVTIGNQQLASANGFHDQSTPDDYGRESLKFGLFDVVFGVRTGLAF